MRSHRRARERGVALVLVLVVLTLLMAMGAALHSGIMADTTLRSGHQIATQGFYAAEAGVNLGINTYRQIFLNQQLPQASDYNPHTFMLGPRTVTYQLCQYGSGTAGCPLDTTWTQGEQIWLPSGQQFSGMQANAYRYVNSSNSQLVSGDVEATLGSLFEVDEIPIFQWLAFYAGDLEILPGPAMNLHGPIHTNGNLYLNSNNTLTITNCNSTGSQPNYCAAPGYPTVRITAVGDIYRGRKDTGNSPTCGGTVQIGMAQDTSPKDGWLDLRTMPCGGSSSSNVLETAAMLANWLGTIKSHVQKITVPQPSAFAYLAPAPSAWSKADLRIVLDWNHPDTNGRYAIFAADSAGNVDLTRTTALQSFMNANPGDIFYNDVPTNGNTNLTSCGTSCGTGSYCNHSSYSPPFPDDLHVYACTPVIPGCSGGYIQNETLTTGTLLVAGSQTARRGGFYDYREGAWLRMLNVNVHDLLQWNRAQGGLLFDPNDTTDGGIVLFLTVVGPGSSGIPSGNNPPIRYAVRIFGSSDLDFPSGMADPTGLTVVSDQAVYVEGNYNVGTATHPKMPAAVIGDTINVLSYYWSRNTTSGGVFTGNDYQSYQNSSSCSSCPGPNCISALRAAAAPGCTSGATGTCNTYINAAFIGGVNPTSGSQYSGGFENYPRFHEDWSGTSGSPRLTYRGSFVSLGAPLHNNGNWNYGLPIYTAPGRDWDYDPDFQNSLLIPPLTPMAVGVEQILFTENFK